MHASLCGGVGFWVGGPFFFCVVLLLVGGRVFFFFGLGKIPAFEGVWSQHAL